MTSINNLIVVKHGCLVKEFYNSLDTNNLQENDANFSSTSGEKTTPLIGTKLLKKYQKPRFSIKIENRTFFWM